MKYIIDTHVFLWALSNKAELSKKVLNILKSEHNEIFVSSVTLWEISIKTRINKLKIEGLNISDLPKIIKKLDFHIIDLNCEDAIQYKYCKENTHKDPFDRMLIQQSINRKIPIISKDKEFKKFIPFGLELVW